MSEEQKIDQVEALEQQFKKDAELERLKDEVAFQKATLDKEKYTQQLAEREQNKKDLEKAKTMNFGAMSQEQVDKLAGDLDEYVKAAKNKFQFLVDAIEAFSGVIPFFAKNLILIAAHTGKGKSTAAANIAYSVISQKHPINKKSGRALIITNEEKAEDFYGRVICLLKGWHYVNHDELTEEQVQTIKAGIKALGKSGILVVVDNVHDGTHGMTTTVEGIESIFENMISKKDFPDVVLIDYYQNVIMSKDNPNMDVNAVQTRLAKSLDQYKNLIPAPIILMAQCDQETEHDHRLFKYRINGRKVILDGCTFAFELVVNYALQMTEWTVWKSRYTRAIGKSVKTGFKDGKYVEYSTEFQKAIQERNDRATLNAIDAQMDKASGADLKEKMEKTSEADSRN